MRSSILAEKGTNIVYTLVMNKKGRIVYPIELKYIMSSVCVFFWLI